MHYIITHLLNFLAFFYKYVIIIIGGNDMGIVDILIAVAIGAVAGYLASLIMGTKGGLLRNIILGIIGGAVGKTVFNE